MFDVVLIAGVPLGVFDRLVAQSGRKFAPDGRCIPKPSLWNGYEDGLENRFINDIQNYILTLPEKSRVSISMLYVDHENASTRRFVSSFFPFALVRPVPPMAPVTHQLTRQKENQKLNAYLNFLETEFEELKRRRSVIKLQTNVHNLTPLLLPPRNFRHAAFYQMLRCLYDVAGVCPNLESSLSKEISTFFKDCPRVFPPSEGSYPRGQHCMSDGVLYFSSPGKDRHGYFRIRDTMRHEPSCLLNARSRLGGWYDHSLHYDCKPVRGSLNRTYENCHSECIPPAGGHVNISPNDFIR